MKKILLPLAGFAALVAFSNANAATGEELFKSKNCFACHMTNTKLVGPAFTEVASKRGDDVATVANSIQKGSSGTYGAIPMPPNAVTEEEATILAEWVLTHK